MQKISFIIFFLFGSFFYLFGQYEFIQSNLIEPNQKLHYKEGQVLGNNLDIIGQNLQWDFSEMSTDEVNGSLLRLALASEFPDLTVPEGCNRILIREHIDGSPAYQPFVFYKADFNGLHKLGRVDMDDIYIPYIQSLDELTYPVAYQPTPSTSSYAYNYSRKHGFDNVDSIRYFSSGEMNLSVPGFGTLKIPGGVNHEVLAIQRTKTQTDSIENFTNGNWVFDYNQTYSIISVDFLSPQLGYYVMRAEFVSQGDDQYYVTQYLDSISTVGVNEIKNNNINIFPNPANDYIYIQSEVPLDLIELYDMQGRKLKTFSPAQEQIVDVSDLQAGIYLARCIKGENSFTQKIVVQ